MQKILPKPFWIACLTMAAGLCLAAAESFLHPIENDHSLSGLADAARGAKLILLGESTHGTSEFYSLRDAISRKLIAGQGNIAFVAVEGDWAAIERLNRYVLGDPAAATSAESIMLEFDRWPQWMWANREFLQFVEWLREWNSRQAEDRRTALYGLDIYGWHDSLAELESYLAREDPELAERVRPLFDPIRPFLESPQEYALASYRLETFAAPEIRRAVEKLRAHAHAATPATRRAAWSAKEHAHVVAGAERHFRAMAFGGAESWNARVDHMKSAIARRMAFYGDGTRGIFWAHNTHIGDARATGMASAGQRNMGQLARQQLGRDAVFAVGFSTLRGTAMAGRQWGANPEVMTLPTARPNSLDALLAARYDGPYWILTADTAEIWPELRAPHGMRAVGVVYQPENEEGNYVPTLAAERFDAIVCLPETSTLQPLHPAPPGP